MEYGDSKIHLLLKNSESKRLEQFENRNYRGMMQKLSKYFKFNVKYFHSFKNTENKLNFVKT